MPRTLPWLLEAAKSKEKHAISSSASAPKRKTMSSTDDLVDSDLNPVGTASPKRRAKKRPNRTPSTSPPPAPPDVEYMREGYNADDIYMMVEDEFHTTAKMFTQHIHHAEYVRLKRLARSRGAGTLEAIERSTDGRIEQSTGLRMRLEAEERARWMKDGLKNMGAKDDSSDEDEYMRDPQLAGLMAGDKSVSTDLSGIAKARSNTRAAAGFSQSPRTIERKKDALAYDDSTMGAGTSNPTRKAAEEDVYPEHEDGDLDSVPPKPTRPIFKKGEQPGRVTNGDSGKKRKSHLTKPQSSSLYTPFAQAPKADRVEDNSATEANMVAFKRKDRSGTTETRATSRTPAKDFDSRSTQSSTTAEYLAKRRADKERKAREEKRKAQRADDIPTFII